MNKPRRSLGVRPLVGALYFMVAGGPYGLEELLAKTGPWLAALVLVVTPIVWSLPTALMVGELGAALPEEGGYYAWVKRALGPFFGFQEAWLSLAASVFDMAIYPAIFVSYLARFWPSLGTPAWSAGIGVALLATCALLNLLGSKSVGDSSVAMTVVLLIPFAALSLLLVTRGAGVATVAPLASAPPGGDLLGGILVAMWNLMGWDNASTIASEVDRPQRTYPRGVMIAVALVTATYLVPTLAVAIAQVDVHAWETGAWVELGGAASGALLRGGIVIGGMLCGFGMLNALVLSYSRIPAALADDGLLPAALGRRGKNDAPIYAVLACAALWTLSLGLKFDRLVALDILLYGTSLMLEFVALVVLRVREPDLPRPYRIPGGLAGAALAGVGPLALLIVALVKNAGDRAYGMNALVFGLLVIAAGPLAYVACRRAFGGSKARRVLN